MKTKVLPLLLLVSLSMVSCLSYDADEFDGKIMPRVASYTTGVTNDWIYFNLRTGEVFNRIAPNRDIKEGQQKDRLDWDIAFCGYHIRTNSGTSGNGMGGAIDLGYGDYDRWHTVDQLPMSQQWVIDNDTTVRITHECKSIVRKKYVSLWSADDLHAVVPCLCSAYRRRKTLFQITDYQLV